MVERRKQPQALEWPPIATSNPEAVEILRVWAARGFGQQITLRICWTDPAAWGLLLVDIARHASQAYQREGHDPKYVLARIREAFDAEWSSPTSAAEDLTEDA